jgi:hypothetical protein
MHLPTNRLVPLCCSLLSLFVIAACTTEVGNVIGVDGGDLCAGQACSGRGTCAIVDGKSAVCLCNAGSFAEGLECKAVVAGAECDGVTCNGRGACVVLSGMPNSPRCDCNADSVSAGATTCVAKPAPCAGITCSGRGTCAVAGAMPVCVCEAGFRAAAGNTCEALVVGQECQGIDCGGHGTCAVAGGAPLCSCEAGYDRLGTTCVARAVPDGGAGPCAGVACSGRGQCAVIAGTTPVCACSAGYVANSLSCVLQGTVGGDVTVLAGALGGPGFVDGTMNTRFDSPRFVTHDAAGNVYVGGRQSIRKLTPSGTVSTLAGSEALASGYVDGVGAAARFTSVGNLVTDSSGSLFVTDISGIGANGLNQNSIRKITPSGVVSTVVRALPLVQGVFGIAIDASNNLWVSGTCLGSGAANFVCLLRVTPTGVLTPLPLTIGSGVMLSRVSPSRFVLSGDGNTVFMVTGDGPGLGQGRGADVVTINANTGSVTGLLGVATGGNAWTSTKLSSICRDGSDNLWVSDDNWNRIYRVPSTGGAATLIAGNANSTLAEQEPINIDGPGANARFYGPTGLSCDSARGKVYVADTGNHTIRSVAMGGNNVVTTIAGTPVAVGAVDGTGAAAQFRFPQQLVADSTGSWFVADSGNAVIRKITPAGVVSLFAGSFGMPGSVDGTGTAARFSGTECLRGFGCHVIGLAIDSSDNVYVADRGQRTGNQQQRAPDAIRKITPAGVVTTLASGTTVNSNAVGAQFGSIAVDSTNGDVYFNADNGIRRLRGGVATLVVPSMDRLLYVAVDSPRRKLFVVSVSTTAPPRREVERHDLSGAAPVLESTLDSDSAPLLSLVDRPGQLGVAPNGALAIAFPDRHVILRVDAMFSRVDKIAGEFGSVGVELGPLPARLTLPTGVAFNAAGQLGIVMGRTSSGWGEGALLVTTGFTP